MESVLYQGRMVMHPTSVSFPFAVQMGEQLMVQPNPSAEMVRRQLQTLQEQWQLLKQMAANQSKAVGGLRNLQEFNQKAEQLEAWIRQKVHVEDKQGQGRQQGPQMAFLNPA